ncbi:MAG: hypothetical protein ACE37N_10955 [Pseudohongiellaceae bacterium]
MESLERLLPVADEMLAQLVDFLRRRDLATSHLVFALQHENRAATEVSLGLRQPSRDRDHLLLLLETHFAQLSIPAPVCTCLQFDALTTDAANRPAAVTGMFWNRYGRGLAYSPQDRPPGHARKATAIICGASASNSAVPAGTTR